MRKIISSAEVLKRQRDFYNKKYAKWPQLNSVDLFWQHVSDEIIRYLNIKKNKRYLYLGVGDGFVMEYIARKTGAYIYGIDVSDYSLRFCNDKKGFNTTYVCADAQRLPFKINSFNGVIAPAVLHHLPDLKQAFAEFKRVMTNDKVIYSMDPRDYFIRRCLNFFISRIISEDEIQFKQRELEEMYITSGFKIRVSMSSYLFIPIIVPLFKRIRLDIPEWLFRIFLKADTYLASKRYFQPLSWTFTIVANL
ncbi:MAG: class I SAM-dependent methyltransferase [Candidatus Hodarchaeales archaeon]|jgi:ubiquinone/menaquinone biosynthesis C-methylase UbiE